jgi:transposase InsO family protein
MHVPLPRGWPTLVRSALIHAVSLARAAVIEVRSGFENSPLARARLAAKLGALRAENALLREELRIKDARMEKIPARRRSLYPPAERLAILAFRAAAGMSAAATARRFLLTPATIASWMKRLDDQGEDALVQLPRPINRFPDFVAELVQRLKTTLPAMGKVRIAQLLARTGVVLAASTVKRLAERPRVRPVPPGPLATAASTRGAYGRVVTARYPHHVWHVDLTTVPIGLGLWVPWLPFSFALRWPFAFHVVAVLDHFSRYVVATGVFLKQPTAEELCAVLDAAVCRAGRAPTHIVSDQGSQFRDEYLTWCKRKNVRPRFGKIGEHGSIAVIERFFRSFKQECFRKLLVPMRLASFQAELSAYVTWYNDCRPHQGLGGAAPAERLGRTSSPTRPIFELRPSLRARGDPPPRRSRACRALQLRVHYLEGRRHLPLIELRRAA